MDEKITVGGLTIRQATDHEMINIRRAVKGGCKPFRLINGALIFFVDVAGAYWGTSDEAMAGEIVAIPPGEHDPDGTRLFIEEFDTIEAITFKSITDAK